MLPLYTIGWQATDIDLDRLVSSAGRVRPLIGGLFRPSFVEQQRDIEIASQTIYVYVADLDAHHARAVAAGATITQPLSDTDYGSREYAATDREGHQWSFGTYRPGR